MTVQYCRPMVVHKGLKIGRCTYSTKVLIEKDYHDLPIAKMERGRALRSTLFFILVGHSTAGAPLLETAWSCSWEIFPQRQRNSRVGLSKERCHDTRLPIPQKINSEFRPDGGRYGRVMAGLPRGLVDDVLGSLASMNGGHLEGRKVNALSVTIFSPSSRSLNHQKVKQLEIPDAHKALTSFSLHKPV